MNLRKLAVLTALLLLCGCSAAVPACPAPQRDAPAASVTTAEQSAPAPEQSAPVSEVFSDDADCSAPFVEASAAAPEASAPAPEESAIGSDRSAAAPDVSPQSAGESAPIVEETAQNAEKTSQTAEETDQQPAAAAPVSTEERDQTAAAPASAEENVQTAAAPASAKEEPAVPETWDEATTYHRTLCFTGDINLAEGQYTTAALDSDGLKKCVGKRLRRAMRKADLLCVNNEFAYTNRGTPLEGKAFTFRADPSRTAVMKKLGADAAIVANNHVFDYCEEGLTDTLDALSQAGIDAVGAGRNLKEASAVHYYDLDGCKVALLAASRVEWSAQTRPATEDGMGVFYTAYDTDLLYRQVKRAKKKADFVVVCMHWGMEGTADLEEYQTEVGKGLVKAGADLVVGDHPHQLQGVKFVKDTPVYYSLGNFWFNRREEYTMLLRVRLSGDKYGLREVRTQVIPAWQGGAKVRALSGDEGRAMFDYLAGLPGSNIRVDKDGFVTKKGK